jgi:hypothetical protein
MYTRNCLIVGLYDCPITPRLHAQLHNITYRKVIDDFSLIVPVYRVPTKVPHSPYHEFLRLCRRLVRGNCSLIVPLHEPDYQTLYQKFLFHELLLN